MKQIEVSFTPVASHPKVLMLVLFGEESQVTYVWTLLKRRWNQTLSIRLS